MEKRLLLAIALSFSILVIYQLLIFKRKPQPVTSPEVISEEKPFQRETTLPPAKIPSLKEFPKEEEKIQPTSEKAENLILVDTSLYQAVWSNKGAVLKSWKLKEHKDEEKNDLELVSQLYKEANIFPFSLWTEAPEDSSIYTRARTEPPEIPSFDDRINSNFYKTSKLRLELKDGQKGEIRFEWADDKGNSVEKIFTFQGGRYDFEVEIKVKKNRQKIEPLLLWGPSFGNRSSTQGKERFGGGKGIAYLKLNKVKHKDERKFKTEDSEFYNVNWAAYEDNYFTAIFLLSSRKNYVTFLKHTKKDITYFSLLVTIPNRVYIGSKEFNVLNEFGYETKKIINFGFFGLIAEILLRTMNSIHKIFPNWGISIIILTLIIKIIFFPLTYTSTRSMSRMQELQPKIKALRAKYKKAKKDIAQRRKMNEEMMRLYKEHGINPAGGCLPMLIQLPVFWGFFRLLVVAIEFRHSPFILWIHDLSASFWPLAVLMGITQFISQKMAPTSADPTQARMMLIMPVIMTIFFLSFPSGLVLYWLTNNILQIGQQYIMNRLIKKKKRETHGKRRKK